MFTRFSAGRTDSLTDSHTDGHTRKRNASLPEDEDEKDEKGEESGDVVHGSQHDEELIAKCWQEPDHLEYPQ